MTPSLKPDRSNLLSNGSRRSRRWLQRVGWPLRCRRSLEAGAEDRRTWFKSFGPRMVLSPVIADGLRVSNPISFPWTHRPTVQRCHPPLPVGLEVGIHSCHYPAGCPPLPISLLARLGYLLIKRTLQVDHDFGRPTAQFPGSPPSPSTPHGANINRPTSCHTKGW